MNKFLKIALLIVLPCFSWAQNIDSLKTELSTSTIDSVRYNACKELYRFYEESNRDSALRYADLTLQIAKKNNRKLELVVALATKAYQTQSKGNYPEALKLLWEAFEIAKNPKNDNPKTWSLFAGSPFDGNNRLLSLAYTHHIFAILMWQTQNIEQELFHFKEARRISKEIGHAGRQMMAAMNLGRSYAAYLNQLDSALFFEQEGEQLAFQSGNKKYLGQIYSIMALIYYRKGDKEKAIEYYYKSIDWCIAERNYTNLSNGSYFGLTKFYLSEGPKDSALHYAIKNLETYRMLGSSVGIAVNLGTLYQNIYLAYQMNGQTDSAYKYQGLALQMIDSLTKMRIKNLTTFQNTGFNEQLRLQNIEKEKITYQNKIRTYFFIAGMGVLLLLAFIFYRNNRQKQKANKVLQQEKDKVESTLHELKSTQAQLIQSEKMASLGELTAGIAHEIQNPLNFVNNFSEVSGELIEELKSQKSKLTTEEQDELLNDIYSNLEKINHHGKRAADIVKGMLQHSSSGSGKKEPTNINALADEYLRLAYHGLRAKDKTFNATMKTDFDESIGNINIIPQDIGRVILNLITNAFYVVNEKSKQGMTGYEPNVEVSTKKEGNKVLVAVKDNGNGIPQKILDKIFQPFFTTKPTGQGTGLGLSLSYDIVKAHGGELQVETKEGEGTEFIILLPIV